MEDRFADLKVIFDDENMIGKVEVIIEANYRQIKYDIDNIGDYEERLSVINEKIRLIDELITECNENKLGYKQVIKVSYNPMGDYYYEGV